MILTKSESQIFIKVKPDSLYTSFTTLDVEIYPNQKINSCSLIFSNKFDIISVEIEKEFLKTFSSKKVVIYNLSKEKINFKLKIDNAVEDSGDKGFPIILSTLRMKFFIEVNSKTRFDETPCCNIRILTHIPDDCKGKSKNSRIKIGNQVFDSKGNPWLIQLTDGYPKTNISYYTQNVGSKNKQTEVDIKICYFPAPLLFIPSLIFPFVFGVLI